jgi:hypothetical protein
MTAASIEPPTFEAPPDNNSNYEIWCLRAPAHLDVSEILNGVTLDLNTKALNNNSEESDVDTSNNINTTLARFKADKDGQDYELTIGDKSEVSHLRLLVPDKESNDDNNTKKLKAHKSAFQRYINLTSATMANVQDELALAPSRETAPRPAFGELDTTNGAVPAMRLAYVPVPQKQGLKRRWAMPGSSTTMSSKRIRMGGGEKASSTIASTTPKKTSAVNIAEKSSKKKKKKKEKKEKKSKKSPKK